MDKSGLHSYDIHFRHQASGESATNKETFPMLQELMVIEPELVNQLDWDGSAYFGEEGWPEMAASLGKLSEAHPDVIIAVTHIAPDGFYERFYFLGGGMQQVFAQVIFPEIDPGKLMPWPDWDAKRKAEEAAEIEGILFSLDSQLEMQFEDRTSGAQE